MIKKFNEFLNESNSERDFSSYGWYNMANALDISSTVIPELRKNDIQFRYDSYSNHIEIEVKDDEQANIANKILTEIGEGDKDEDGYMTEESDSALITPLKYK